MAHPVTRNIPGPLGLFFPAILLTICLGLLSPAQAGNILPGDQCITRFKTGTINWTTGQITARGHASPQDNKDQTHDVVLGSARADANRCLLEILKNLRISNSLTVGGYASDNDIILAGVEATARDAVTTRQYYTSALDVELTVETQIFGGFLQLVLPEEIRQITAISPEPKNLPQVPHSPSTAIPYTGLIIDARELDFDPVLYPVILSEQGHDIYSAVFISREFAVQKGVCRYTCTMAAAKTSERIGPNPLIFKGLRKSGKDHSAIIISTADTKSIEKATERHAFFKECRVVIVLGQ